VGKIEILAGTPQGNMEMVYFFFASRFFWRRRVLWQWRHFLA
jgi:hypothetical protein